VEPSFLRLFTVEEANALLPKLRELLEDVALHRDSLREKAPHLEPILKSAASNGGGRIGSEYGAKGAWSSSAGTRPKNASSTGTR
jgi:hypothetical protein